MISGFNALPCEKSAWLLGRKENSVALRPSNPAPNLTEGSAHVPKEIALDATAVEPVEAAAAAGGGGAAAAGGFAADAAPETATAAKLDFMANALLNASALAPPVNLAAAA